MEDGIPKKWLILLGILGFLFVAGCSTRVFFLTFVDSYELGYKFDKTTGQIDTLNRTGWHFVKPLVTEIHTIDLRPMQIKIEANNRVLNAMLVRFKKEGLMQFVELHGRGDYSQTDLSPILMSYAYEGYGTETYDKKGLQHKYKFLEILGRTSTGNELQINTSQDTLK